MVAGNVTVALAQVDDANPAVGTATYYLADSAPNAQINTNLGCVTPGRCRLAPNASCSDNTQCTGAGNACLSLLQPGRCSLTPTILCSSPSQCPGAANGVPLVGNVCNNIVQEPLQNNQLQVDYGCPTSNNSPNRLPSVAAAAQANTCMP